MRSKGEMTYVLLVIISGLKNSTFLDKSNIFIPKRTDGGAGSTGLGDIL